MERKFTCNRWPFYQIGDRIKFENGSFCTSDPELIRQIEANDAYGVQIVNANTKEQIAAAKAAEDEARGKPDYVSRDDEARALEGGARQGLRGTGRSPGNRQAEVAAVREADAEARGESDPDRDDEARAAAGGATQGLKGTGPSPGRKK